jgi:hypothetical protein
VVWVGRDPHFIILLVLVRSLLVRKNERIDI